MKIECEREQDVLDALTAQRWPGRCDAELRSHVHQCAICTDLVTIAAALLDDREAVHRDARIPPSGVVWWRAQLRARDEDARAAARPIAFVQGAAASAAVWLIVALVRSLPAESLGALKTWVAGLIPHLAVPLPNIAQLGAVIPLALLVAAGAALLLAPVAFYLAVDED